MPLLTKKFTRDSLRRANGGGVPSESENEANAEMIRREMARARAKSMRSRTVLNQQHRRHRPSLPLRPLGGEKTNGKTDPGVQKHMNSAHPNDEYSQAFSEAELLTQMSSLTEPTWAPSVVGGSDINSTHNRQNHQNQRSRTANYNTIRHQNRFQSNSVRVHPSLVASTFSTAKDQKETALDGRKENIATVGHDKSNTNRGHHERASVGSAGLEVHRSGRDDGREDDRDDKTVGSRSKDFSKDAQIDVLRDNVPDDELLLSGFENKPSLSTRRSKTSNADDESKGSRQRGRSGRPSGKKMSKRRSSSISSRRSTQSDTSASTAPTISKRSSTSSSMSSSLSSRKSKTGTRGPNYRRVNGEKAKSSTNLRSSSVPPSTSNSKRNQRTSSMPPKSSNMKGIERNNRCNRDSNNGSELHKNETDITLNTASTMADLTTASSQSNVQSKVSFATGSRSSTMSPLDSFTPSSSIEAARMSLRPRLRRSNSNRSVSSTQSESVISAASSRRAASNERPADKTQSSAPDSAFARYESRRKDVRESKQRRRHERQTKKERRKNGVENRQRLSSLVTKTDSEEPYPTTATTLLTDVVVFYLLLLVTLPQRVVLNLWSRTFSKKWTARRRNVLVTGANSALGSETARQFATEGANLILVSHSTTSTENGLAWLVDECQQLGSGKVRCYSADPANTVSIQLTLRQAAKDFEDTFDIVILNGETKSHGCLFEQILDAHQIEKMVTENTLGCIVALHNALKHIPKSSDSRIVVLSSTSGVIASPYRSVYGATQHALKGFCDSIRMELNDTYTEKRAPKICFASFPELVGQNIQNRDSLDQRMSRMGADVAPMKTRTWAGIPLQQAVHDLVGAITSGERDFGAPGYVSIWRFFELLNGRLADFSIFRHSKKTQYRPVEGSAKGTKEKNGDKYDGASVSNKTWS